jgi:MerR family transcriptional regulator, light-induced transcriptional regulator
MQPEKAPATNDLPLYNIGAVARMTGISIATLRAWERRYSFPQSKRTAGGHRLYSERDVIRLRWVKAQIDAGMQTAQAVHNLAFQEREARTAASPRGASDEHAEAGDLTAAFQQRLLEALKRQDLQAADQLLGEALAAIVPEALILHVIGPTLDALGYAWETGEISVAAEHLASNYLRQRLLLWILSSPPPRPTAPVVLACAPGEWHEGSLLILGALLRRRRWPIAYLGQAVPLPDLAAFVRQIAPAAVVLVAMTEAAAAALAEWPTWLPEAAQAGQPPIGYGGRIFNQQPAWRPRMPGVFLGSTIAEGLANLERLLEER